MLTRRFSQGLLGIFATVAAIPDAAAQRPGKPLIEQVITAMGGQPQILGIRTLILEGTGDNFNLGQNPSPEVPLPRYAVTAHRRVLDFANRRWQLDVTRAPRFPTGSTAPQRIRTAYDRVAFDILPDSTFRRGSSRADIDRRDELIHHPIGFLQAAMTVGTELTEENTGNGPRHVRMNVDGNKFAIFVDRRTKLPTRIEKWIYHPVLGDVVLATHFTEYRDANGLMLPMRIVQQLDGRWTLSDIRFVTARVNTNAGNIAASDSIRSAPPFAQPVNVTAEEIAAGVWLLAGQSHHSVAIEMRDHMLLVEAPQNEARTLAVIRRVRELKPGKPIRAVINTHHHFDHAGGLRAAIAEGLTVITHSGNMALFSDIARRRHFIVTDALAQAPKRARIETVTTKRVLADASRTVEIHHIRGNPHAATLLMVYLPAEKLLIQADVYSPPAANAPAPATPPAYPFAANLVDNIDRLKLEVDRIVPIHGPVVPIADLRSVAANRGR